MFAQQLYQLRKTSDTSMIYSVLNKANNFYIKKPMIIDDTKWPAVSKKEIFSKFNKLQEILKLPNPIRLKCVAKNLYFIDRV